MASASGVQPGSGDMGRARDGATQDCESTGVPPEFGGIPRWSMDALRNFSGACAPETDLSRLREAAPGASEAEAHTEVETLLAASSRKPSAVFRGPRFHKPCVVLSWHRTSSEQANHASHVKHLDYAESFHGGNCYCR